MHLLYILPQARHQENNKMRMRNIALVLGYSCSYNYMPGSVSYNPWREMMDYSPIDQNLSSELWVLVPTYIHTQWHDGWKYEV